MKTKKNAMNFIPISSSIRPTRLQKGCRFVEFCLSYSIPVGFKHIPVVVQSLHFDVFTIFAEWLVRVKHITQSTKGVDKINMFSIPFLRDVAIATFFLLYNLKDDLPTVGNIRDLFCEFSLKKAQIFRRNVFKTRFLVAIR